MASTSIPGTGLQNPFLEFIRAPTYVDQYTLGASSANSIAIPPGVSLCEMKASLDFFVKWGSTGVSTVSTNAGGASELIPVQSGGVRRNIGSSLGTTAITAMSTAAANLTVAWWTI